MDLTPPVGQRVPVEGVGGRVVMGQRVVVRGWQWGPQSRLAVVWRACKEKGETTISDGRLQPQTLRKPGEESLEPKSLCWRLLKVANERELRPRKASQGQLLIITCFHLPFSIGIK